MTYYRIIIEFVPSSVESEEDGLLVYNRGYADDLGILEDSAEQESKDFTFKSMKDVKQYCKKFGIPMNTWEKVDMEHGKLIAINHHIVPKSYDKLRWDNRCKPMVIVKNDIPYYNDRILFYINLRIFKLHEVDWNGNPTTDGDLEPICSWDGEIKV